MEVGIPVSDTVYLDLSRHFYRFPNTLIIRYPESAEIHGELHILFIIFHWKREMKVMTNKKIIKDRRGVSKTPPGARALTTGHCHLLRYF